MMLVTEASRRRTLAAAPLAPSVPGRRPAEKHPHSSLRRSYDVGGVRRWADKEIARQRLRALTEHRGTGFTAACAAASAAADRGTAEPCMHNTEVSRVARRGCVQDNECGHDDES